MQNVVILMYAKHKFKWFSNLLVHFFVVCYYRTDLRGLQVGPSTFFSSKQFEVFDVELLSIQNCTRRTIVGFYSDVVCG